MVKNVSLCVVCDSSYSGNVYTCLLKLQMLESNIFVHHQLSNSRFCAKIDWYLELSLHFLYLD